MRAITTTTAAEVLSIDRKALDNLLTRVRPQLLSGGRQGVERRIPIFLLEDIALTGELAERLGIPIREAFRIAQELLGRNALRAGDGQQRSESAFIGSLAVGPFIQLGVDLQALRADLHARLEQAIEAHVRPRRGRPRRVRPGPAAPQGEE